MMGTIKKAIIRRVTEVLASSNYTQEVNITIHADMDSVPSIKYEITEGINIAHDAIKEEIDNDSKRTDN